MYSLMREKTSYSFCIAIFSEWLGAPPKNDRRDQ